MVSAVLCSAPVETDSRMEQALCHGPACGRCLQSCPGDVIGHWDRDWAACDTYRSPHGFKQLSEFLIDVMDDGDPEGGASCGSSTGWCMAGTETCLGGALQCTGGRGPRLEECNSIDDDCNGTVDDGYDTDTDIENCGGCGGVCSFPNAVPECVGGSCGIAVPGRTARGSRSRQSPSAPRVSRCHWS